MQNMTYQQRMKHLVGVMNDLFSLYTPPPQAASKADKANIIKQAAEIVNHQIPTLPAASFSERCEALVRWVKENHEQARWPQFPILLAGIAYANKRAAAQERIERGDFIPGTVDITSRSYTASVNAKRIRDREGVGEDALFSGNLLPLLLEEGITSTDLYLYWGGWFQWLYDNAGHTEQVEGLMSDMMQRIYFNENWEPPEELVTAMLAAKTEAKERSLAA